MKRVVRAGSPEILKIAGDSSPSAAESSFRELDDVFLQTQTRIWLGEVLHIRFNEETTIADLLADGELLFQVSKVVWKMLLKKHAELKHSKVFIYERTSSGKSDGRYMPYPKVDSFLKICQILGLTGVDLFSPSDVVEKKDVRRVCMCIRSFSKKARSKNLNVPDFDIVTYTIAMPSDLVGGIRRYLEQSQYSSSSSTSTDPREIHRQRSLGGRSTLHYDSHSESDEAESSFNEFEFQSPLQDVTYDVPEFSSLVKQDSAEEITIVDDDICDLESQFGLDMPDNVFHKSSIQNSYREIAAAVHSKPPFTSHIECQSDEVVGNCFSDVGEAIWPLRNKTSCLNISTNGNSLHDLDEPHAVAAEETFLQFGPAHWSKGLETSLPKCSSADSNEDPKIEFVEALEGPSSTPRTFIYTSGDDFLNSENMGSSSKNIMVESRHTTVSPEANRGNDELNEEISISNDEGDEESSITNNFQMDPNHSINEVPLAGVYTMLQSDTSDLYLHNTNEEKYMGILENCPILMESVDLDNKIMKTGHEIMSIDEAEIAQVGIVSRSIGHRSASDSTAGSLSFPQVNNLKTDELSDGMACIPLGDNVSGIEEETIVKNKNSNMITFEKCATIATGSLACISFSDDVSPFEKEIFDTNKNSNLTTSEKGATIGTKGSTTNLIARVGGYACDNEVCDAISEFTETHNIESMRTSTSTSHVELSYLGFPSSSSLNTHHPRVSFSDSTFVNDQVLATELVSPSDTLKVQCNSDSSTCSSFSELSRNESNSSLPANNCLEEGDNFDASSCHLSMEIDVQVRSPHMSLMNGTMIESDPLVDDNKIYENTAPNVPGNLLVISSCNSNAEGDMNGKASQKNDASYHSNESNADPLVEIKETCTEKLKAADGSHIRDLSSQVELVHDGCKASEAQIVPLPENGIAEKELVRSVDPCLNEGKLHGQKSKDLCFPKKSSDIHSIQLDDKLIEGGAPEETFTCSTSAHITERETCNEDVSDVKNGGDDSIIDDPCAVMVYAEHEAEDSGERKEQQEHKKELLPKHSSNVEASDRSKGNAVLKSVAGAMTVVGAIFLIHHVRQKREKEKDTVLIAPQQSQNSSKELPPQKRVVNQKPAERPAVLYPGERLKL